MKANNLYSLHNYSVADLITGIQNRDETALNSFYNSYSSRLYSFISKMLADTTKAEIVLQRVLVKACREIHYFNRPAGEFFIWLLNLSRSETIEQLIASPKGNALLSTNCNEYQVKANIILQNMDSEDISNYMQMLSPVEKTLMSLTFFRGLSCEEISSAIHLSINVIEHKIKTAHTQLEAFVAENRYAVSMAK